MKKALPTVVEICCHTNETAGGRAMKNIPLREVLAKLPVGELDESLNDFLGPVRELLPEERLRRVVTQAVRGILAQETPVIAAMAQSISRQEMDCWAAAKRIYRFVESRGRSRLYRLPPSRIRASGVTALGSCLR